MTRVLLAWTCALALAGPAHAGPAVRDPFARPVVAAPRPAPGDIEAAEPPPVPLLRAVIVADPRSLANIDGHVVGVGDSVAGWRVLRIAERSVTLGHAGTHITISLKGSP